MRVIEQLVGTPRRGVRRFAVGTMPGASYQVGTLGDAALPVKGFRTAAQVLNPTSKIQNPKIPSAFTLLELLVVMGMMALLLALIVPAFSSVGRANQLTAATQAMLDQLNRARQEALSRNRSVQFQIISSSRDGSSNAWRAIRYIILNESGSAGSNAITNRVAWLPQSIIISPSSTLSVLPVAGTTTNVSLPGNRTGMATYFTFRPDGTTDITDPAVHWTLVDEKIAGDPPPNFSTIQVDTRTGRPRLFRP